MIRWPWVRRTRLDRALAELDDELGRHRTAERQLLVGLHALQWFPIDRENDRLRRALARAAWIVEHAAPDVWLPVDGPEPCRAWAWLAAEAQYREADTRALFGDPPAEVVAAAKALPVTHPPSTSPED